MGISGSIDHASETRQDRHDLSEDEAVVLAIERYKKATGVSCVKDPERWHSAIDEGRRLEAIADKAAEERNAQ